ncbi:hypothetical protein FQZ97_1094070 [compost metagenome]
MIRVPYCPTRTLPTEPVTPVPLSAPVRIPVTVSTSPWSTSVSLVRTLPAGLRIRPSPLSVTPKFRSSAATGVSQAPWMVTVMRATLRALRVSRMR